MKIREITDILESRAPLGLQEDYDNAGLIVGDREAVVESALICVDVIPEVVEEALASGCRLILSHHPPVFKGIRKISGKDLTGRVLLMAIKNNIAIYSAHTNLDNAANGVNAILAGKLGLTNLRILQPKQGLLRKLVTFCPAAYAEKVRNALFEAGAGKIGNYDCCSYNLDGTGSFRALPGANPFAGKVDQLHFENEVRIETIYPAYLEEKVLSAMFRAHPYEEVAYDLVPLANAFPANGAGITGELPEPEEEAAFLQKVKNITGIPCIRHTAFLGKPVTRVALCGGSGSFLIREAMASGATVYLTADIKYHDFFDADSHLLLADIGHFESEQFAKELIYGILKEFLPNFALRLSQVQTNPVNYL